MDLFQNLGLHRLSWAEYVKIVQSHQEENEMITQVISKDNLSVYLVEIKPPGEVSREQTIRLFSVVKSQLPFCLNLNCLVVKEDSKMFLSYEKSGTLLTDYLAGHEVSVELRLFIYRQIVELVYTLVILNEKFEKFDQNLFFIQEKEISPVDKLPVLKIIYHGK